MKSHRVTETSTCLELRRQRAWTCWATNKKKPKIIHNFSMLWAENIIKLVIITSEYTIRFGFLLFGSFPRRENNNQQHQSKAVVFLTFLQVFPTHTRSHARRGGIRMRDNFICDYLNVDSMAKGCEVLASCQGENFCNPKQIKPQGEPIDPLKLSQAREWFLIHQFVGLSFQLAVRGSFFCFVVRVSRKFTIWKRVWAKNCLKNQKSSTEIGENFKI